MANFTANILLRRKSDGMVRSCADLLRAIGSIGEEVGHVKLQHLSAWPRQAAGLVLDVWSFKLLWLWLCCQLARILQNSYWMGQQINYWLWSGRVWMSFNEVLTRSGWPFGSEGATAQGKFALWPQALERVDTFIYI